MDRPAPLRTDSSNAFAHYSMRVRVPKIARGTLAKNADVPAFVARAVERLAAEIESDGALPEAEPPGPDVGAWRRARDQHAGETWLATTWFFAELFFYRQLAQAWRFWETGRDPFAPEKEEELAGERPWERLAAVIAARGDVEERIFALLGDMLWANRVDLSYAVGLAHGASVAEEDLLADDRAAAARALSADGAEVHLVADNAGTELVLDLALADALLAARAHAVVVHVKMQPVFVSDATAGDVHHTLERMRARGGDHARAASRLRARFDDGRLRLAPDPFWSGPSFLWEMPEHLASSFARATIVVFKGDANYRRVIGDAVWPSDASFAEASAYFPAPLVCVRTMKSDPLVGVDAAEVAQLDAAARDWRIDGRRGLVQGRFG